MKAPCKLLAAAVLSAGALALAVPANAEPIAAPSSLQQAAAPTVETVAWRGGGWRGWGPGLAAGAIIGGAIAATQPWYGYGYYNDYAYAPGYDAPSYSYEYAPGYVGGDAVAYCQQRFRSYDPASGTYLGYDGERHPCP
jgi:hypothetical protein